MKQFFSFFLILLLYNVVSAQTDSSDLTRNALIDNAFKETSEKLAAGNGMSTITSFSSKDDTKGSRYLFPRWVKGSIVDIASTIYNNPGYFYNYDKVGHALLMTANRKDVIEIDAGQVKSFTLKDDAGEEYFFKKIPLINPSVFLGVIAENDGAYSAYKLVKTNFEKANFHTDGMVETGKNYDEYVDVIEYYVGLEIGTYQKVDLTKKSLKKAFDQNPRAAAYFSQHKADVIDENYLKGLIIFLNKN